MAGTSSIREHPHTPQWESASSEGTRCLLASVPRTLLMFSATPRPSRRMGQVWQTSDRFTISWSETVWSLIASRKDLMAASAPDAVIFILAVCVHGMDDLPDMWHLLVLENRHPGLLIPPWIGRTGLEEVLQLPSVIGFGISLVDLTEHVGNSHFHRPSLHRGDQIFDLEGIFPGSHSVREFSSLHEADHMLWNRQEIPESGFDVLGLGTVSLHAMFGLGFVVSQQHLTGGTEAVHDYRLIFCGCGRLEPGNGFLERSQIKDFQPGNVVADDQCFAEGISFLLRASLLQEAGLDLKKADIKLLDLFFSLQLKEKGGVTRSSLRQHYAAFAVPLKRLIDKGLLDVEERQVFRDPFAAYPVMQNRDDHTLTKEQEQVIAAVQKAISQHVFTPFLLFGVTGSGKTEVYLRAVEAALHKNRTALVLVPEIALASQLETDFRCRFGDALAVVHSGLREGERFDQWQHVLTRKARVVLGARSAVFVPLTDIGIIIVDEEHESAYKQEDGLPYHGRDLAVVRARQENCPIILGSATPTVNSFHNAKSGKYQLLSLPERISGRALPAVHIVDMKNKKEVSPESWLLSERLLVAIQKNLAEKQQSLLFVNRRGFATFMQFCVVKMGYGQKR